MGDERMARVPRIHPQTGAQKVQGRWLAATADERLHRFEGEVSERIMELVDGRRSVALIVDAICDEFDVDRQRCEGDVVGFLQTLVGKQILEW